MPLRIYDNNAWQSPTSVRIYNDSEWKHVSVGYVYDMGVWRVVFPDPIIPNITINNYLIGDRQSVYVDVLLTNSDYIVAELYLGTNQSTLVSTQTIDTLEDVFDSERITFTDLQNNTTYNMKITAYSITENTYTVLTGPATTINVIIPTASITSITNVSLNSVTVNWTSTNQYYWNIEIYRTSDGLPLTARNPGPPPEPIYGPDDRSWTASFNAIANTQYTVKLTVESISEDPAVSFSTFTTPNEVQPTLSSLTATSTCNSITVNWSGSNYVSGTVSLWFPDLQLPSQEWTWGSQQRTYTFNSSTLSSYTFTGLPSSTLYVARIVLVSSTSTSLDSDSVFSWPAGSTSGPGEHPFISTLAPSANAPTNFTATSDYWGKNASFTWTAATANCTTVSGYRLEYKLSTSSTWSNLSNSIASNATSFSIGSEFDSTFLPNRTYNFRLYAKTASYGEGPPASVNLTMNNNPYAIAVTAGSNPILTSSSTTLTAQLRNAAYENLSRSGFTVSWSFIGGINPPSGSSISPTSSVTSALGQATTTFSSGTDDGTGTVYATTSGLSTLDSGQIVMTVNLRTGLTPSLTSARTNFGYDITVNNYDSSYTWGGSVTNGGFNFNSNWQTNFYTIVVPPINTSAPVASQTSTQVTCTLGGWNAQPSATTTVTTNKPGYSQGSSSISNSPTGALESASYTWYFSDGTVWGTGQTRNIGSLVRGKTIRCLVTVTRTGGNQASAFSNFITVPA